MNTAAVVGFLCHPRRLRDPGSDGHGRPSDGNAATSCGCSWTVDQLPLTPDAVEGWYERC